MEIILLEKVANLGGLGDRVKVEAIIDGGHTIFSQFPRRSSLLAGIEPGCRIHIQTTLARIYPTSGEALTIQPAPEGERV